MKRIFKVPIVITALLLFSCLTVTQAQVNNPPVYKNPTGKEFPILAWSTFRSADNITDNNFKIIKEGGFNISLALVADMNLTRQTLRCANAAGIKVMVNCPQTKTLNSIPKNVASIRRNNAVMGYYIKDEPDASQFPELRKLRDAIYKADPDHFPFFNLYPIIEPSRLKAKSYKDYLLEFIKTVDTPMFSYDNYPIQKINGRITVKDSFYENLEIASEVSKETGRPFWAFCMSTPHLSYPTPTLGELQFEAFSALAYGAQGLSYYTYCQEDSKEIKYTDAPINLKGEKTKIWYLCQDNNRQIQALSNVFLGCSLQNAWHTGSKIPKGTKKLSKLPAPFTSFKSGDAGVLVSHIKNKGKNYLVIVSHDVIKKQNIEIGKPESVVRIQSDGKSIKDPAQNYTLEPGGYLIFSWD